MMAMAMKYNIIAFVLIIGLCTLQIANAFVCMENYCDSVKCDENVKCNENQNEVKTVCGCCTVCETFLGENNKCVAVPVTIGGVLPSRCGNGLVCLNGVCTKLNLQTLIQVPN